MAGLLDFFGNMDKRTQMGLLMAGAQMMNTPRQQGGLGAIGNGLLGFAQGLIDQQEKDRTDSRLDRLDAIAARKSDAEINKDNATANYYNGGGKNADPYYTPIPTANGVYGFDNRSGKVQLAIDENGQPVIKSSDSIPLQSGLAGAKKAAENSNSFVELDNADGSKSKMLGGAAFPELLQRPVDLSKLPQVNGNNYGNIRPIGANKGFQSFDTPEAGLAAIDQNLAAYGSKHGINTLGGVISRWSPPNENNTNALIANAAKVTGLDPNQPIDLSDPKIRAMITPAIVKQEHSIDITNPITRPAVLGMQMAAKNGVSPIEAIDKGVAIAEQSVNDLKQVQSAANTIYKGQSTEKKLALETEAKKTQDQNKANIDLDLEGRKKQQEKAAQLPDTMADFDNLEKTVNEIENHPGLSKGVGFIGKFARGFDGFAPHDFAVKAKQFGDQAFLAQIPKMKGFGQLTEAEGARLVSSLSTLGDPTQSEEQYRKEIGNVRNWLKLARERASSRAGVEQPQVSHIDSLLDKYK